MCTILMQNPLSIQFQYPNNNLLNWTTQLWLHKMYS